MNRVLSAYTFTGQYSYIDDEATDLGNAGFGLMFYREASRSVSGVGNARWLRSVPVGYDPSLGRFAQADTMIPQSQGVQAWDRYAYVNNNPINYTDPTGHIGCKSGQRCNNPNVTAAEAKSEPEDISLNGAPDTVTVTLTADELRDTSDEINEDVNGDDGIRENADYAADTLSTANDLGNLVVGTVVSGITCGATLGWCVFIIGGAFYFENRLTNSVIEQSTASSYADLIETSLYFQNVAHQIDPYNNEGSAEVAIEIYTTVDRGVYIQAEGIQGNVPVSAGVYHYNYDIAPYLQP